MTQSPQLSTLPHYLLGVCALIPQLDVSLVHLLVLYCDRWKGNTHKKSLLTISGLLSVHLKHLSGLSSCMRPPNCARLNNDRKT
jgi:hypothetical protein